MKQLQDNSIMYKKRQVFLSSSNNLIVIILQLYYTILDFLSQKKEGIKNDGQKRAKERRMACK